MDYSMLVGICKQQGEQQANGKSKQKKSKRKERNLFLLRDGIASAKNLETPEVIRIH